MRVLIIYESLFGNTRDVSEAIADGLRAGTGPLQVRCVSAVDILPTELGHTDLLVIGGPTHHKGVASRTSVIEARQLQRRLVLRGHPAVPGHRGLLGEPSLDAGLQAPPNLAPDADLRAWLRAVPDGPGLAAAAFDTRLGSRWSGGASSGIARRLRRHGYHLIAGPEGFVLDGLMGPLRDGELIRAHGWGAELRHQVLM